MRKWLESGLKQAAGFGLLLALYCGFMVGAAAGFLGCIDLQASQSVEANLLRDFAGVDVDKRQRADVHSLINGNCSLCDTATDHAGCGVGAHDAEQRFAYLEFLGEGNLYFAVLVSQNHHSCLVARQGPNKKGLPKQARPALPESLLKENTMPRTLSRKFSAGQWV